VEDGIKQGGWKLEDVEVQRCRRELTEVRGVAARAVWLSSFSSAYFSVWVRCHQLGCSVFGFGPFPQLNFLSLASVSV